MIQVLFGMPSDTEIVKWWSDAVRSLFAVFDRIVYKLVEIIFQVFFSIVNLDILPADLVNSFFGRVQLVLGVVMMFRLAVSLLQVIINPDLLTDTQKGFGGIIIRIIIMLSLFIAIIPLPNIPEGTGSYNDSIRTNGILFGTMFSLQKRVLTDNVIGKLILGNKEMKNTAYGDVNDKDAVKSVSSVNGTREFGVGLAAIVIRGFIVINLKNDYADAEDDKSFVCPTDSDLDMESSLDLQNITESMEDTALVVSSGIIGGALGYAAATSAVCSVAPGVGTVIGAVAGFAIGALVLWIDSILSDQDQRQPALNAYGTYWSDTSAADVLRMVNYKCGEEGSQKYAFAYLPIISTITGIFLLLAIMSFCLEVVIRVFKLAILRLIAPIPIINYVNPKEGNNSFQTWVKMVTSTYIDLFIRLAIIYFIIFLTRSIIHPTNSIFKNLPKSQFVSVLVIAYVLVGLFYFAKQMPKFIKDALGISSENDGLFSGLGKIAGVAGVAGGSLASAWRYGRQHNEEAADKGITGPRKWLGNLGAGVAGLFAGGAAAGKAALTADKNGFGAALDAAQRKSEIRETGSTMMRRAAQRFRDVAGYDPNARIDEANVRNKQIVSDFEFIDKKLDKSDDLVGNFSGVGGFTTNALNQSIAATSVKEQAKVLEYMRASGKYSVPEIKKQNDLVTEMKKKRYAEILKGTRIKSGTLSDEDRRKEEKRQELFTTYNDRMIKNESKNGGFLSQSDPDTAFANAKNNKDDAAERPDTSEADEEYQSRKKQKEINSKK